jgi:hypothetical protein
MISILKMLFWHGVEVSVKPLVRIGLDILPKMSKERKTIFRSTDWLNENDKG